MTHSYGRPGDRPDDRTTRRMDPYRDMYRDDAYGRGDTYGPDERYRTDDRARYSRQRQRYDEDPDRVQVDSQRLWTGGVVSAIVAAGVAAIGLFIARGLLHVPVFLPQHNHTVVDADGVWLGLAGFLAGIIATAILHALMIATPRPRQFFGWIIGLAMVAAALWPFSITLPLYSKIAGAVLAVAVGFTIIVLLGSVSSTAIRRPSGYGRSGYDRY